MVKVLVSLPDDLVHRMRALIPTRQRSGVIVHLIEGEVERREKKLYQSALAVEKDAALQKEMADWDATVSDGLNDDESW
jgi:hypothetical protein